MTVSSSPRLGLTRWSSADDPFSRGQLDGDHADLDNLVAIDLQIATLNNRPAAGVRGRFCTTLDTGKTYRDTGSAWLEVNPLAYGKAIRETFGTAGTAGVATTVSRSDHVHPMPDDPIPAHVAASDPHPQYVTKADTGWISAGFGAKSGFTTAGSAYRTINGITTVHMRFTRSSSTAITAGAYGGITDTPALAIPADATTDYLIPGTGSVIVDGQGSYGFVFHLAAGVLSLIASTNPNVSWPKGASFYATATYAHG